MESTTVVNKVTTVNVVNPVKPIAQFVEKPPFVQKTIKTTTTTTESSACHEFSGESDDPEVKLQEAMKLRGVE